MSANLVRVNGAEVTTDAPDRTVINITINQASSLTYLMESVKSLGKGIWLSAAKGKDGTAKGEQTMPGTAVSKGEQKTLGAVQIILGIIFFAFGIVHCFVPRHTLYWNGTLFWTGVSFILSGAVSVLSERRSTRCWLLLAPWMNLASFAVAIAGIVFLAANLSDWCVSEWCFRDQCEVRRYRRMYETTSTNYNEDEDRWRVENCKEQLSMLGNFGLGVNIILLIQMVLMLCITFFSVVYGWKVLCCNNCTQQDDDIKEKDDDEQFLAP